MSARDAQRGLLYEAESAALGHTRFADPVGGPDLLDRQARLDAVRAFVEQVVTHASWDVIGAGTGVRVAPASARLVRVDARWRPDGGVLEVTPTGCSAAVVTHELAHAAVTGWARRGSDADASDPGHGARYAARLLDVAGLALGALGRAALTRSFTTHGVGVDPNVALQPALDAAGLFGAFDDRTRAGRALDDLADLRRRRPD